MKKTAILFGMAFLSLSTFANAETTITNPEVVKVSTIKDVNPLCQAVAKGDLDTVKKMIEFGTDINSTSSNGMTPLMYAARYNKTEIVQFLLDNGANVKLKDSKGNTALQYAEFSNAKESVEILKNHKKK